MTFSVTGPHQPHQTAMQFSGGGNWKAAAISEVGRERIVCHGLLFSCGMDKPCHSEKEFDGCDDRQYSHSDIEDLLRQLLKHEYAEDGTNDDGRQQNEVGLD